MAIHDQYARRTPYELFLPTREGARETFEAIREEADERGVDPGDPERFVMLMAVGEALRELRGPADDPERIRQHGQLLYHAFHFREADEPLWLLTTPAARYLVEARGDVEAGVEPPAPAGYLQLPQHLFWLRREAEPEASGRRAGAPGLEGGAAGGDGSGGEAPVPESVDGVFWSSAGGRLSALVAAGVRPDRPGFSVVGLAPVPLADAAEWAELEMREEGEDFRSEMPGAELDGLYEVRHAGEVLKLLARAFRLIDAVGGERQEPGPAGEGGDGERRAPSTPPATALPWRRVGLE